MAGTSGYSNLDVIHHIYSTRVQASTGGTLLSGQEAFISHAKRRNPSFLTNIPADLAQLFMDYGNRIKSDSLYDKIFRKVFAVLLRPPEGIPTNKFERIFSLYFLPRDGRRIHDDWIMTMLMVVNDLINSVLRSNELVKATEIVAKAKLALIPDNRNVIPIGFWVFEGWRQVHAQLMDPNRPLCLMTKEALLQSKELPRVEVKIENMASWRTKFVNRKGRIGVGISPDNTNRKIIYGFILTSLEKIRGYAEARRIQYTVGALSEKDPRVDGLVGIATEMKKHNTYKRLVEVVMKRCMRKPTPQAQMEEFIRHLTIYIIGPTCNSSEQIASACLLLLDLMIIYLEKSNFDVAVEVLNGTMNKVFNERKRKYLMDNIWDEFQNRDKEAWLRSGHFNFMNNPGVLAGSTVTELTTPSTSQTASKISYKDLDSEDREKKRQKLVTATKTLLPGQSIDSQSAVKSKPKVNILQKAPSPQLTIFEDVPPLTSPATNIIQVKSKHRYIDGPLPGSVIHLPGITLEDSHRSQAAGHFVQRKDASSKNKNKSRKTARYGVVTAPTTSGAEIKTTTSGKTRTTISGTTTVATTSGTPTVATTSGALPVAATSGPTIPSTAANVPTFTTAQAEMVDIFLPIQETAPVEQEQEQEVTIDYEPPGLDLTPPDDYNFNYDDMFPEVLGFEDFWNELLTSPPLQENNTSTYISPAQGDSTPSQRGQQQASGDNQAHPVEEYSLDQLDDEEFWQQFAN